MGSRAGTRVDPVWVAMVGGLLLAIIGVVAIQLLV